jgi:hypothetical protein
MTEFKTMLDMLHGRNLMVSKTDPKGTKHAASRRDFLKTGLMAARPWRERAWRKLRAIR